MSRRPGGDSPSDTRSNQRRSTVRTERYRFHHRHHSDTDSVESVRGWNSGSLHLCCYCCSPCWSLLLLSRMGTLRRWLTRLQFHSVAPSSLRPCSGRTRSSSRDAARSPESRCRRPDRHPCDTRSGTRPRNSPSKTLSGCTPG